MPGAGRPDQTGPAGHGQHPNPKGEQLPQRPQPAGLEDRSKKARAWKARSRVPTGAPPDRALAPPAPLGRIDWRVRERHRLHPRAPDPRLARQPDRRGRGRARVRRPRPRRGAVRGLDRRVRGGRAARRRRGLGRQGRLAGGRQRQRRDRRGADRRPRRRAGRARRDDDRARRHARTRAGSAPTRSSASRWPPPRPPRQTPASRSTATWPSSTAAASRRCCRCR